MFFQQDAVCASISSVPNASTIPFKLHDARKAVVNIDDYRATSPIMCGLVNDGFCVSKSCASCQKNMDIMDPISADIPTTEQLQQMVEKECIAQAKDWIGSIVLPCTPMKDEDLSAAFDEPSNIDVCKYFNKRVSPFTRLQFSITEFPPPKDLSKAFEAGGEVWEKLKILIERESYKCNSPVICGHGSGKISRSFVCQACNSTNKKKRSIKRTDADYRETHLSNDGERGERQNGRSLPRRTSAQNPDVKCSFKFSVKCDAYGYYITLKRNGGNATHSNHPKYDTADVPFPPRLMTDEEKKDLKSLHETSCGNGVCSAHLLNKMGKLVPRSKIAYMCRDDDDTKASMANDIDALLRGFEEDSQVSYSVLWDVPTFEKSSTSKSPGVVKDPQNDKSSTPPNGTKLICQTKMFDKVGPMIKDVSNELDMSLVSDMARDDRKERSIPLDKNLFIAVAWTYRGIYYSSFWKFIFLEVLLTFSPHHLFGFVLFHHALQRM